MTDREKRCEDCICLIKKNGKMCCDECFGQLCNEIDECPEGVEIADIEKNEKIAKEYKVDHKASAETVESKKDKKPRTVITSDEKKSLFSLILAEMTENFGENAQILKENKLIAVKIGEKTFKIDIIEQRKPKN